MLLLRFSLVMIDITRAYDNEHAGLFLKNMREAWIRCCLCSKIKCNDCHDVYWSIKTSTCFATERRDCM